MSLQEKDIEKCEEHACQHEEIIMNASYTEVCKKCNLAIGRIDWSKINAQEFAELGEYVKQHYPQAYSRCNTPQFY